MAEERLLDQRGAGVHGGRIAEVWAGCGTSMSTTEHSRCKQWTVFEAFLAENLDNTCREEIMEAWEAVLFSNRRVAVLHLP